MKRLLLLFFLAASSVFAQRTTVTATVKDSNGTVYALGSYGVTLVNNSGQQATIGGNANFQQTYSGQTLTSAGVMSISLPSVTSFDQSGIQWQFRFCANPQQIAAVFPAPALPCFSYTSTGTQISGASVDITSSLTPAVIPTTGGANGLSFVSVLPATCSPGQQFQVGSTIYTCGPNANQFFVSGTASVGGPIQSGLIGQYQMNPTDTVASLKDYSSAGNNATGTVGTAPTIIPVTGGIQCNSAGAILLPSAVNAGVTFQFFVGYQNTVGTSASQDQSWFAGNGNGTTSGAVQFILTDRNGTSPANNPARAQVGIEIQNSLATVAQNNFYGNDVISWVFNNPDTLYQGSVKAPASGQNGNTFGNSLGKQTTGVYQICGATAGSGQAQGSYFSGQVYYILVYNRALSDAEVSQNVSFMRAQMAARGVQVFQGQTTTANNLVIIGDSISVTTGISASPYSTLNLYDNWNIINNSFSGTTSVSMVPNAAQTVDPLFSPNSTRNVALLATGSNDICLGPSTIPNYLALLQQYRQFVIGRKLVGWKVLLVTVIDRTTCSSNKNTWNTLIRQMWAQIGADGLIDYAAIPQLGADGANTNATYFQDLIHPTATGAALMATAASFIINRLYGNSYNSGAPITAKNIAAGNFMQQIGFSSGATNGTSWTGTFPNPIYPGSTLFFVGRVNPTSITDTNGDTWAQVGSTSNSAGIWQAVNVRGGEPNTVTINQANNVGHFCLAEYSGLTSSPFDVTGQSSGSGTALTSNNVTTTAGSDLLIGAGFSTGGGTYTPGGGATQRCQGGEMVVQDVVVGVAGSYAATTTQSVSGNWSFWADALKTGVNSTYPMGAQDIILYCDPTNGNQTVNLPEAQYLAGGGTANGGATLTIKNLQQTGLNTCTLAGINSETIDGASTILLPNSAEIDLKSTLVSPSAAGANWVTIQNSNPFTSNCKVNSVSPAACGAATAGTFAVPTTTTSYTVNTTAVGTNSEIVIQPTTDNTGIPSAPTCVAPTITTEPVVSARVAGTSFTITIASTTGITCWHYTIVNK